MPPGDFFDAYTQIADAGELLGQQRELVVVSGEERARADAAWRYSSVAQASARPSKVAVPRPISSSRMRELLCRGIEDGGGLGHLDHEGGAAARHVVAGADAGVDAVDEAEAHAGGGNEAAHLRHDDEQRCLTKVGGFAAHVGAGDAAGRAGPSVEIEVVGDEATFGVLSMRRSMTGWRAAAASSTRSSVSAGRV